jgi:hypothetical protein
MMHAFALGAVAALVAVPVVAMDDHKPLIEALTAERLRADFSGPEIIAAVLAQNAEHAGMAQDRVDALDLQWRAEVKSGGGPLIAEVMDHPVSRMLQERQNAYQGLVTEVFVMDYIGLNVAQSEVTSDYWQGDEDKFQKTYPFGPDAVFVDEVDFDESAQVFQAQVSFTLVDPATGAPIGAVTVGVDVEQLLQ